TAGEKASPPARKPAARARSAARAAPRVASVPDAEATPEIIPRSGRACEVRVGGRTVNLTNLQKPFWPELGITKGDLLRYYVEVAPYLLPHLVDRAMVMKRYPNGWKGPFFFMKRTPEGAPEWLKTCSIEHASKSVIDFPMVQNLASLLWVVNLGCIDLNPWYARCDDTNLPDFLHFDLDPVEGADFARVRETALMVHDNLRRLGMKSYAKTTGSSGIHVYVPIVRGPTQKQVWSFAKEFARAMEKMDPALVTAEYRVARRPHGRVLVDYNQNAWGRTLSSIYSVRAKPGATVSMPVTWEEVEGGVELEDFTLRNAPARIRRNGDLWKPVLAKRGRFDLGDLL
ncbi:MAG TPA: non-homologous end-joining DNA ligase, partial [Longimicrobium sp.]|nr:non-homologous end-joining DNA ligase [Longimicrobium sp.]